jgi:hypothetical protein
VRRSKEFEERKAEFESLVMSKALGALKEHNHDVESIGEAVNARVRTIEHRCVEAVEREGHAA